MDADAEAQEEGHQQQVAVVAVALPPQHQPHSEGAEEHRHTVHLALHGGEPDGVAEEVAKGAAGSSPLGIAYGIASLQQQEDGFVEQQHREGTAEDGDEVAQRRHPQGVAKGEQHRTVGHQLVEGGSRRMPYLKSPAGGDELATIPPAGRQVHSEEVGGESHQKNYQFTTALLKISSHSSVTISPINPASTDEKSRVAE